MFEKGDMLTNYPRGFEHDFRLSGWVTGVLEDGTLELLTWKDGERLEWLGDPSKCVRVSDRTQETFRPTFERLTSS